MPHKYRRWSDKWIVNRLIKDTSLQIKDIVQLLYYAHHERFQGDNTTASLNRVKQEKKQRDGCFAI
jgi:hypothetical protein